MFRNRITNKTYDSMTKSLQPKTNWHIKLSGCVILLQLLFVANIQASSGNVIGDDKKPKSPASSEQDSVKIVEDEIRVNHKKISGNDLKDIPASDLENLLQGRLSGFFVQNWNGSPGIQSVMSVNTVNTATVGIENRPLILVNGVPIYVDASEASQINPLSQISPEYIESVEVLNSAISLARYGARGANGVISITTKDGAAYDGTRISVSISGGVNFAPQLRSTISGNQERRRLAGLYNKAIVLPGDLDGIQMPLFLSDSLNSFYGYSSDWQEDDYESSSVQNVNMNIGNSGVYGHYLLHMGYYNEEAPKTGVGMKRFNLNLNTTYNVTNKLTLGVMLLAGRADRGNSTTNLFEPSFFAKNDNALFPPTIFEDDDQLRDVNTNNHLLSGINLEYKISENLIFNSNIGLDYETGRRDYFIPSTINNGRVFISSFTTKRQQIMNENTLKYSKQVNGQPFNVTVGQSIIVDDRQFTEVLADRDATGTSNFVKTITGISLSDIDGGSFLSKNALLSFFADADYEVIDGLTLSGVVRMDGTSKLPEDERWGIYPAIGASWDIGQTSLLEDMSWISYANLNADIGKSGILPTEDHLWKSDIRTVGDYGGLREGSTGVTRYSRTNNSYTNPTSTNYGVGLDLGLFNNQLFVSADYFSNSIKNYHYQVMLPNTVGFSEEVKNGIGIKNTGLNMGLSTRLKFGEISWNVRLNASMIANEVSEMPSDANNFLYGSISEGRPINGFYVFASDGVYANASEVPVDPATGLKLNYAGIELDEGMPRILDKNGDYVLDQNDRYFVGNPQPNVYGGFGNTFEYKGIYVDALFTYALGGSILTESVSNRYTSNPEELNRGMFEDNGANSGYYFLNSDDGNISLQGIAAIESSSYIRLNNLTFGYNFNESILSKLGFGSGRVFITGQNLFVSGSDYSGLDPEENWNSVNGFNLSTTGIPRYKSVSIGLSLGL